MNALNLTASHLAELTAELGPLFAGSRLRKLVALPPRDLLLCFERPAPPRLRVSASPDFPRIHLQAERQETHPGPIGPFYRRVAEELDGATLERLRQVAGDRMVELVFGNTPSGERRSLLAELTGRHANLLLLGPAERVLAWLVPPPRSRSGARPRLVIGEPWRAPPGTGRTAPAGSLLEDLPDPGPPPPGGVVAPLSWRVECCLGAAAEQLVLERARKQLLARLERKLKRARALEAGLERRLQAALGAERVRQDGELLKAHMHALRRGQASIELPDLFEPDAPPRTIELDPPPLAPRERRAHLRALPQTAARQAERGGRAGAGARAPARAAGFLGARARRRFGPARPGRRGSRTRAAGPRAGRRRTPPQARPGAQALPRVHHPDRGARCWSARAPPTTTCSRCAWARGNDLWLHTRDAPGSHVVLRLERGAEPDEEDLLDAAHLAAHFSPLRESTRVAVHVSRRKHVHKPKGAKPGLVTLSGGRVVQLRVQPQRIRRLLASARRGPSGEEGD